MRLRTEIRREFIRPTTFYTAALILVLLGIFTWGGAIRGAFILLGWLSPFLLLPIASLRATEDRRRGLSAVQATAGLQEWTSFSAKACALFATWTGVILLSAIVLAVLLSGVVSDHLAQLVGSLIWLLLGGFVSLAAGLLVGYLSVGRRVRAVSISASMALVWLVSTLAVAERSGTREASALLWMALSGPLAWMPIPVQAARAAPLSVLDVSILALVVLGGVYLGVAGWVATAHQRLAGWREEAGPWPGLVAVSLALVLVALPGVVGAVQPQASPQPPAFKLEHASEGLTIEIGLRPIEGDGPFLIAAERFDARMRVGFIGPPNATVRVEAVEIAYPGMVLATEQTFPSTYRLDRIQEDPNNPDRRIGSAFDYVPVTGSTSFVQETGVATVTLVVDGEPVVFTLDGPKDWAYRKAPSGVAASLLGVVLALVGHRTTRRMNKW